jgi:hypothetical protein
MIAAQLGYVNQPATPDFPACSSAEDASFVRMLYMNTVGRFDRDYANSVIAESLPKVAPVYNAGGASFVTSPASGSSMPATAKGGGSGKPRKGSWSGSKKQIRSRAPPPQRYVPAPESKPKADESDMEGPVRTWLSEHWDDDESSSDDDESSDGAGLSWPSSEDFTDDGYSSLEEAIRPALKAKGTDWLNENRERESRRVMFALPEGEESSDDQRRLDKASTNEDFEALDIENDQPGNPPNPVSEPVEGESNPPEKDFDAMYAAWKKLDLKKPEEFSQFHQMTLDMFDIGMAGLPPPPPRPPPKPPKPPKPPRENKLVKKANQILARLNKEVDTW